MRLKKVNISSAMITQLLTKGYSLDHVLIEEGLEPGAVLRGVSSEPGLELGGVPQPIHTVTLLFEHESFDDVFLPAEPPLLHVVVRERQEHAR